MHIPVRYEDRTKISKIKNVEDGNKYLLAGKIIHNEVVYRGRRNLIVHIETLDASLFYLRFINFYPNQLKQFSVGKFVHAYGVVKKNLLNIEMVHPDATVFEDSDQKLPSSFTPIYSVTSGLGQKTIVKFIENIINDDECRQSLNFGSSENTIFKKLELWNCFLNIHKPNNSECLKTLNKYQTIFFKKLKYAELLAQRLFMQQIKQKNKNFLSNSYSQKNNLLKKIILKNLSFDLTNSQKKVISEIESDFKQQISMNRLLQGDVGSGKTIVGVIAASSILSDNNQVAFMAPTEILAKQHFYKLKEWLQDSNIVVSFLSGSVKGLKRKKIIENIENNETQFIVGTHALFQEGIKFKNLGLCIIDEQHRFGVNQRIELIKKGSQNNIFPHLLMMSATPIPRTLAMSFFADLDVSTISELPKNRIPIKTKLIRNTRRAELIEFIKKELIIGNQIYWVCPLIEESNKLDLKNVTSTYQELKNNLPEHRLELIHGKMNDSDKEIIMDKFQKNKVNLLVATTVIEVGVDVPNASLMIIENAERMGLSQLHQLRGRVGRGDKKSLCILLFKENLSENAKERLKIIFENLDGFIIAENDLRLRGPGEIIGTKQSGIPELRVANIVDDSSILMKVNDDCNYIKENLNEDITSYVDFWFSHKSYSNI